MSLHLGRNSAGTVRLGIAAGRRLGNAVVRNRIKRLVREVFRCLRAELPTGSDWIVVPRTGSLTRDQVEASFRRLAGRLLARGKPG